MIDTFASKLAKTIKDADPENTASIAVLKYGLIIVINLLSTICLSVLIGLVLGKLEEVLLALLAFSVLRAVSGGLHLKSAVLCTIVSVLVVTITPLIHVSSNMIITINIINCLLVLIFAPSKIEDQSNIPEKWYPALKVISLIVVGVNFY